MPNVPNKANSRIIHYDCSCQFGRMKSQSEVQNIRMKNVHSNKEFNVKGLSRILSKKYCRANVPTMHDMFEVTKFHDENTFLKSIGMTT